MIEILVLIFYTRKIGSIAQAKGREAGGFKVYTVFLWFGCEFLAMIFAAISGTRGFGLYPPALAGAVVGAGIAYVIADRAAPGATATSEHAAKNVSPGMMMYYGAGLLLFMVSFFEWNKWNLCVNTAFGRICSVSVSAADAGWSGWHGLGLVMGLSLIVLLAWEALLLAQAASPDKIKLPELPFKPILISIGIGALTVLFGVIRVFEYGARTWVVWIALLLMLALAAGLFLRFQEGEAKASA
jgi:hypothetical protein